MGSIPRALQIKLTTYRLTGEKWIKDLNIRPGTIKLIGEDVGEKLLNIGFDNNFLYMIPKAQTTKARIKKWDYIELKSYCTAKETINKIKRQPTEWEKIFANFLIRG